MLPFEGTRPVLQLREFTDALCIIYGWPMKNLLGTCECGTKNSTDHALICKLGGFVIMQHHRRQGAKDFDQFTKLVLQIKLIFCSFQWRNHECITQKAIWIRFYTIYKAYEAIGLRDEKSLNDLLNPLEIFCVLNFKTVFEAFLTKFSTVQPQQITYRW